MPVTLELAIKLGLLDNHNIQHDITSENYQLVIYWYTNQIKIAQHRNVMQIKR